MYIWTAINVEEQLCELKKKVKEVESNVGIIDSVVNLPLHISLKISFSIDPSMQERVIDEISKYYSSISLFDIPVCNIERMGKIVWIRMKENEILSRIHSDLDKVMLEKFGVSPHEFDLDYKFHATLFMESDEVKVSSAYNKIKNEILPERLVANHFVIGSSETGAPGTYKVTHNIKI